MAQAVQEVSVRRGVDPRDFALVASRRRGQHVCAVARRLGIRRVLLHPLAGLLSAWGIGLAERGWDGQQDAGRVPLEPGGVAPRSVEELLMALLARARGPRAEACGSSTSTASRPALRRRGDGAHGAGARRRPWDHAFESATCALRLHAEAGDRGRHGARARARAPLGRRPPRARARRTKPRGVAGLGDAAVWFPGSPRPGAAGGPRRARAGDAVEGPAVVLEDAGTIVIEPGFRAELEAGGLIVLVDLERPAPPRPRSWPPIRAPRGDGQPLHVDRRADGRRAPQHAVSTNIKERLDYSCAVFDREGGIVANAPHIPVHLGAMGATVRAVKAKIRDLARATRS